MNTTDFFIAGGTLLPDAPSYVTREADDELFSALSRGVYCYVLTARQMGKSSLMVRTAARLREAGLAARIFDPTGLGQNLTIDQWYVSLLSQLGRGFEGLEEELEKFWLAQPLLSPVQRWTRALGALILPRFDRPLVIFVDEIDYLQSLPFPLDEFFAALRECYNLRAENEVMRRVTFCLFGVATPADLIRDARTTPFNIGRRIELHDFTPAEVAPLAHGLRQAEKQGHLLLKRVLHWTSGHPYLTQRLCQAVAAAPGVDDEAGVDRLCRELFLTRRARELDDNLLFVRDRLLRSEKEHVALLDLYASVRKGKRVADDGTNPAINALRLAGITRAEGDWLKVRNRIYERVFDATWIASNLPDAEARQRRKAYWRGLWRAGLVGAALLLLVGSLALVAWREGRISRRATYYAEIRVAQQELENANISRVEELLLALKPQTDLRGFEWDYLWQACHLAEQSLSLEYPAVIAAFAAADQQLVVAGPVRAEDGPKNSYRITTFDRSEPAQVPIRLQAFEAGTHSLFQLIRFSASAQRILVGDGARASLFERAGNARVARFEGHPAPLSALALAPSGNRVVTADSEGELRFSEVASDGKTARVRVAKEPRRISKAEFSADGRRVVTVAEGVSVWDFATGQKLWSLAASGATERAIFSPSGAEILLGTRQGELQTWDLRTRQRRENRGAHLAPITALAYSPDDTRLATGSEDRTVRLWEAHTLQELATIKGHGGTIDWIAWSRDSQQLAIASDDQSVKICDVGQVLALQGNAGPAGIASYLTTAFNSKQELLAVGVTQADGKAKLLDVASGAELVTLKEAGKELLFAVFSPDARLLALGGKGNTVEVWQVGEAKKVATLTAAATTPYVIGADFSPDGKRLAFVSDPQTVKVWSTESWQELRSYTVQAPRTLPFRVAFSSDGKRLAAACRDGSVVVWSTGSDEPLWLQGHTQAVRAIAFSHDGSKVATGGRDLTLCLWDAATGRLLLPPRQAAELQRLAFSPDDRRIVSGSHDGAVKVWETATGNEMLSLPKHAGEVRSISFSTDGKNLATSGADGLLRRWRFGN